ncbi:MAG: hypothetical protein ABSG68_18400 [Thermoguttaceae bacterium]
MQIFTQACSVTQSAISQAAMSLWLLMAVIGYKGLLGIAFIPDSTQSSDNPVVVYHPVAPVTSSRIIRYDRRPRRPGVVAIATGLIVAVLVLAVVWVQMTFFHAPAAMATTGGGPGQTQALARRKDDDQSDGPDPMSAGGAAIRIESPKGTPIAIVPQSEEGETPSMTEPTNNTDNTSGHAESNGHTGSKSHSQSNGQARKGTARKRGQDIDGLIRQAEALRSSLRDTLVKNNELLQGLKAHRRCNRAMQNTIASLRQLKTLGV